jgi:hypothetical protein
VEIWNIFGGVLEFNVVLTEINLDDENIWDFWGVL